MNNIFRSLQVMFAVGFFAVAGVIASVVIVAKDVNEVKTEISYQHRFGTEWQAAYETDHGSLAEARTKDIILTLGAAGIVATIVWLYRLLTRKTHSKRRHHDADAENESPYARIARYRRNAILGVYFGLAGIALGVLLVLFRLGMFHDRANETALGIFIFVCGYIALVSGCGWWLKAKGWTEAIVFIAFMPLVILFIPFVRLIVFAAIGLLAAAMVMAPLILVVVVFALPDKSGMSRRRPIRIRNRRI